MPEKKVIQPKETTKEEKSEPVEAAQTNDSYEDYTASLNELQMQYQNIIEQEAALDQAYNSLLNEEAKLNDAGLFAYSMALEHGDQIMADAYLAAYQQPEQSHNQVFENDLKHEDEKYANLLQKLTQGMV